MESNIRLGEKRLIFVILLRKSKMIIDFETYLILNSIIGRCNQLQINGSLCDRDLFEDHGVCALHTRRGRASESKTKTRPKPKKVNMNTISFHIAQAVLSLSRRIGSWKVSTQSIERYIIANKHYAPRKNMLKKRLGEMVERGELIPVKRSYRLTRFLNSSKFGINLSVRLNSGYV